MKKHLQSPFPGSPAVSLVSVRSAFTPPALLWSLLLLLACGPLVCPRVAAATDDDAFKINVTTTVERVYTLFSKKPAQTHSKLYSLAWIRQAKSGPDPLAQPVDETQLLQNLHDVLAAHGFHEPEPGKVPDIVLTVVYGRSRLRNPYDDKSMQIGDSFGGGMGDDAPVVSGDSNLLMQERTPGLHDKMIAAGEEKVFIGITAWEFPGFMPKAKPKQLWRTVINVDDPDLDLNSIEGKMLAAGAAYFDHDMDKEGVTVMSNVPEGRVISGTPTNVPPANPDK